MRAFTISDGGKWYEKFALRLPLVFQCSCKQKNLAKIGWRNYKCTCSFCICIVFVVSRKYTVWRTAIT